MATLLAKNADVLVTMDGDRRELRNAGLFARDGFIELVGPSEDLPETADTVLDLRGHILLPGLINCHHHLDQMLTRNLPGWAEHEPLPLAESALPGLGQPHAGGHAHGRHRRLRASWPFPAARRSSTTPTSSRMVARSTTRSTPRPRSASASSSRAAACRWASRRAGCRRTTAWRTEDEILKDSVRVIQQYHDPKPGSMLQIVLAPCSPFSVTADLMRESAKLAREYGVKLHTHLCETLDEERYTLQHHGTAAGGLHGDAGLGRRRRLVRARGPRRRRRGADSSPPRGRASATARRRTCGWPRASRRSRSTATPGCKTGLGVDGSASNDGSNLLVEVREAMLLARLKIGLLPPEGPQTVLSTSDPLRANEWMTARDALEIATIGGAAGARPRRHRLAGAGQVRRLLHARSQQRRLCRRSERPGRRGRLLRPDGRAAHGRRRPPDRRTTARSSRSTWRP